VSAAEDLDFSNLDWLTLEEAATYCRVSRSQFIAKADQYSLFPRDFMGKKLYEKAALYAAIYGSKKWHTSQSTGATVSRISTGATDQGVVASVSEGSAAERLRKYEQRKKRS
jgi:hypothetical protein